MAGRSEAERVSQVRAHFGGEHSGEGADVELTGEEEFLAERPAPIRSLSEVREVAPGTLELPARFAMRELISVDRLIVEVVFSVRPTRDAIRGAAEGALRRADQPHSFEHAAMEVLRDGKWHVQTTAMMPVPLAKQIAEAGSEEAFLVKLNRSLGCGE